jgi:DNA-directed RNA polymerase specialized sigma24 family protein
MYTVARNAIIERYYRAVRLAAIHTAASQVPLGVSVAATPTAEDALAREECLKELDGLLDEFGREPGKKGWVIDCWANGIPYEEMHEMCGVSAGTLRVQLLRALKEVRERLGGYLS